MSKIVTSEALSLIYIQDIRIGTDENELTDADFAKLSATKEYKALVEKGKFIVSNGAIPTPPAGDEPKEVGDMTVAELKVYAVSLGLEGMSQAKKPELLEAIKEATEE